MILCDTEVDRACGVGRRFGCLPPHTALRYEQPAAALRVYVTSYLVLDTEPVDPPLISEWMLPG